MRDFGLPHFADVHHATQAQRDVLSAYQAGREARMGEAREDDDSVFVELLVRHTDADGVFDRDAAVREAHARKRDLGRRHKDVIDKRCRLQVVLDALDRLIKMADESTSLPHRKPVRMLHMRTRIKSEFLHELGEGSGVPTPVRDYRLSPWFDFRRLPIKSDGEMTEFGKELVNEGIVRLPFPMTVFAFPNVDSKGREITVLNLLRQADDKIVMPSMMFFGSGKPVGVYGKEYEPTDNVYYALAVLSSRATITTRRSVKDDAEVPDVWRGDSYVEVSLRLPCLTNGGPLLSHASPRLHWRRGHIRRLAPERVTWVRPTLVGKSENGVVVADYGA